MKKTVFYLAIVLTSCISKTETNKISPKTGEESPIPAMETNSPVDPILKEKTHIQNDVYEIEDMDGLIYDPYDFPLEEEVIKALLGGTAVIKKQYFAEREYANAYTYIKITQGENEISFYDYRGKHEAKIFTPKLPLLNGIGIGMHKTDFLGSLEIDDENAKTAKTFSLWDEYGEFSFYFRKDTLYLIKGYYEEGD